MNKQEVLILSGEQSEEIFHVSEDQWYSELAKRLSNNSAILKILLKAPVLYRGKIDATKLRYVTSSHNAILLRMRVNDVNYFFIVKKGAVIAGARLSSPISIDESKDLLKNMLKNNDIILTIYDLDSISI